MRMFLLGALSMYIVSCIVAIILNETRTVDIWDFGEVYFQIPLAIVVFPIAFVQRLIKAFHDAVLLRKLGCKPFGKYEQFDDMDNDTLEKIRRGIHNTAIKRYCRDIIFRRAKNKEREENEK